MIATLTAGALALLLICVLTGRMLPNPFEDDEETP